MYQEVFDARNASKTTAEHVKALAELHSRISLETTVILPSFAGCARSGLI